MQDQRNTSAASDAIFEELRPLMFSIAYRMLGSVGEAEDVVQEAFLRFYRATKDGAAIASPKAFLATVTTRLAIDTARSARVRRETYVGPWLPEPLVISQDPDPAERAELDDSLSLAFLALLQRLTPVERAVFLLREVFDYGYDEIAGIVRKSEDNCRQIFARARKRVGEGKPRFDVSLRERQELADRFFAAAEQGELDRLVELLTADAVFYGDGGGKAHAYPEPLVGRERVGKALWSLFKAARLFNASVRFALVNGQPGALSFDADGRLVSVLALDIADGAVQAVRSIVNPDKLGRLGFPVSDAYTIKRGDA